MAERSNIRRRRNANEDVDDDETLEAVEDRISGLPESLLVQILSLLQVDEVIRTGTLSKRWQHLWTFVPNLVFTPYFFSRDYENKLVSSINTTLILSRASKIGKLHIHFPYKPSHVSDVDVWIRFATMKNVEDLNLSLLDLDSDSDYRLPQHIYTHSSLKSLELESCGVSPRGQISWSSLKFLSISDVQLGENVIERILSGCPVLEIFRLDIYDGFNRLKVASQTLKELVLSDSQSLYSDFENGLLEITAPSLRLLRFSYSLYTRNIRLLDVTALVTADLRFKMDIDADTSHNVGNYCNMVQELLNKLRQVTQLKVATWCIQVLSLLELKGLPSPMLNCKRLKLYTHVVRGDLPGIVKLLEISPYLETLVITTDTYCPAQFVSGDFLQIYDYGDNYFSSQKKIPKCLLLHLKKIEYFGFRKMVFEVELVKFLLKNARVLEKMFIYTEKDRCCKSQEILFEGQNFMSYPRSSPDAVIIFSQTD